MRLINTLTELDSAIAECEAAPSHAEREKLFGSFSMKPIESELDPFSDAYREEQLGLYKRISGKTYETKNEVSSFDLASAIERPFPYASSDLTLVGTQLLAIGSLLRRMDIKPGGRVLEFGPGWGNTTLALAQSGFQVTAVDIEKKFCDLIRARAASVGAHIDVVEGDFFYAESVTEPYDAVVFFECFHHCDDHMRLLRALNKAVKPGGRIYFGGEPIGAAFPIPWGLRLDGESLFAIRARGWLELGFNDRYFEDALATAGWGVVRYVSSESFVANVWEARRKDDFAIKVGADAPSIGTMIGRKLSTGIVVEDTEAGWAFCGPYIRLPAGRWLALAHLAETACGEGTLEVCQKGEDGMPTSVAVAQIPDLQSKGLTLCLPFELDYAAENVELRFLCTAGSRLSLQSIAFRAL